MSLADHIKGLSKDAFIYGAGFALNGLVGLITAPILTRIFVPEDFGVITLIQTVMGFFSVFIGFNLTSGVFRYYFEYDDMENRKVILSTAFYFLAISGCLYSFLIWGSAPHLQQFLLLHGSGFNKAAQQYDYVRYFRIFSVGIFFSILDVYFRSLLRMNRRPYHFSFLSIGQVVLNLVLIIWLVYYRNDGIEGVFWSGVICSMIISSVGFLLSFRYFEFSFSFRFLLQFFYYCLPQFPSVIMAWLISQSSPVLLNYFSTLAEQANFAIAVRVASVVLLFTTAFRLAWDPFALSIMKKSDAPMIYSRIYSIYYAGFGLIGGVLALYSKPILMILAPAPYHAAYALVFMIIAAFMIQEGNNILGIGIGISKRTKFISYAQFIAFLCYLGCGALLIPLLGAWGAVISIVVGMFFQALAYYFFANRLFPIPYKFWGTKRFVLLIFVIVGVEVWLTSSSSLWGAILIASLFTPLLALYAIRFGLSRDERTRLKFFLTQELVWR